MIPIEPICIYCKHYNENDITKFSCKAYIEGIPEKIINGEHIHTKPFKGDNGIRFENKPKK